MDMIDNDTGLDELLAELQDQAHENEGAQGEQTGAAGSRPRRNLPQMMRKIPVTLTLEVGAARVSLQDLMAIDLNSVIELDTLAGEPLTIKVNGTPIGRAEVVVAGDNYGLKVVEITDLDLDHLQR